MMASPSEYPPEEEKKIGQQSNLLVEEDPDSIGAITALVVEGEEPLSCAWLGS